jgi:hypothetical protein
MQLGEKITFGRLEFITDYFEDQHLQEPEPTGQEEEQSL